MTTNPLLEDIAHQLDEVRQVVARIQNNLDSLFGPLVARFDELTHIAEEIANVGPHCTGTITWRDGDRINSDVSAKMVVIHRYSETCPLHGSPKTPKGRVRTYVGTDPQKQQAAYDAIDALGTLHELQRHFKDTKRMITDLSYQVNRAYSAIHYHPPETVKEEAKPYGKTQETTPEREPVWTGLRWQ